MKLATFYIWLASASFEVAHAFTAAPQSSVGARSFPHRYNDHLLHSSMTAGNYVTENEDVVSEQNPLKVLIAGAGVGGLALAKSLSKNPKFDVTVLEQTSEFKRFGGPIQLARYELNIQKYSWTEGLKSLSLTNAFPSFSNAMQILKTMDSELYSQIESKFTVTGDKINGIKDGIRTEWYSKFDLKSPAEVRSMPYTGVIDRPDLQEIYLSALPKNTVRNGDGVKSYEQMENGRVKVTLNSGATMEGDVLLGADGIWSAVRATMRNDDRRAGAAYSGYTLFAGELEYQSPDNGEVGYKVYIGPGQYFVVTDIGKGRYQWYAFLARPPGYADTIVKPDNSTSLYLQNIFEGWSHEIHDILKVTQEYEIEQRDLYDRPPNTQWTDGNVALLGDGIHAMMPNLGQGGCQAIEDALVISEELEKLKSRSEIRSALDRYKKRRYIRSAAVQGLSRFASDIIIRGFDTPAKIVWENGQLRFENFNYAGIVTKMLQPILPIFFSVQFNFLYDGWKNQRSIDLGAALAFTALGGLLVAVLGFELAEAGIGVLGVEALIGTEGAIDADIITNVVRDFWPM